MVFFVHTACSCWFRVLFLNPFDCMCERNESDLNIVTTKKSYRSTIECTSISWYKCSYMKKCLAFHFAIYVFAHSIEQMVKISHDVCSWERKRRCVDSHRKWSKIWIDHITAVKVISGVWYCTNQLKKVSIIPSERNQSLFTCSFIKVYLYTRYLQLNGIPF